ncbi:MAG: Ig-like domain-containing protein, partial [Planctomycetota bacterium]
MALFAGNDPGEDTISHWTIDWGDGNTETLSGNPDSAVHVYPDGTNTYVITASVTDEDGTYAANEHSLAVLNVEPERTIGGADSVDEGSPFTLNLFAGNDPGDDTISHWTVDWGDGTIETLAGNPETALHTYTDGSSVFVITASVTDEDGTYAADDHTVTVLNVEPQRSIGGADSVDEGSPFTLELFAGGDPGEDTISSWTIDWGDGTIENVDGNPESADHVYADGPNTFSITATVTDEDGSYAANDHLVTVLNVEPERSIGGADSVNEGSPFTLDLFAGNDPGEDTISSWTIDWGDGTVETIDGNADSAIHTYVDGPNTFVITATVMDEDGSYAANEHTVTVLNVEPERTIGGEDSVEEGSPFTLHLFAGNDPGEDTIASWTIDWGDGTVQTLAGNPDSAIHTYIDGPSTFAITATVSDEDGIYATNDHTVNVVNVEPERRVIGADRVDEGSLYSLTLVAGNDPGDDTINGWRIDWGDGTVDEITGNPNAAAHTYSDGDSSYVIKSWVRDEDGIYAANDHHLDVLNVEPERMISGANAVDEGSPFTLGLFAGNDPGDDTLNSWIIDWGDGHVETLVGNPDTAVHTYADGPNGYVITAVVADEDGSYATNDHAIEVRNVEPERLIGGADTVDEGSPFVLNLFAGNDPGEDTIASWTIDWGDGTTETVLGNPDSVMHVYPDGPNFFVITAAVTDEDGTYAANDHEVTVLNVEPQRHIVGADEVNEGALFTLDLFAGNDPGDDTITSWRIDWGDGTIEEHAGNPETLTHVYVDGPNEFVITATVTDEDGDYEANNHSVTVLNVEPERQISGADTVAEGSPFTLNLSAGNDPGEDTLTRWVIDWGDGHFDEILGNPETAVHTYADGPNTFVITATVSDEDGNYLANDHTVMVRNVEPERTISGADTVDEGSPFWLDLFAGNDPGTDTIASWIVDWGDGTVEEISGNPDAITHTYADGPDTYVISASVIDEDGTYAANDHTVNVLNVEPERGITGGNTVDEGSPYLLELFAGNDPGDDTITSWRIDWGDGTLEEIIGNPTSVLHTYADGPNTFLITAVVIDEDGAYATNDHAVQVLNVEPERTIDGVRQVNEASPFRLNLFGGNDPGQDTISQWEINWGDGTIELLDGNPDEASHVYSDGPNEYVITATVTDEDGSYSTDPFSIEVLNVEPDRVIGGEDEVDEGSPFSLELFAGNDPGEDTIRSWTIDWGDGLVEQVTGNPSSLLHTYADGPNNYIITAYVTDEDGDYVANEHPVLVRNVEPERQISGVEQIVEGTPFTLELFAGNDPGIDTVAYWTIDWGDGTTEQVLGNPTEYVHHYPDGANAYLITATVTDEDGAYAANDHPVTVTTVPHYCLATLDFERAADGQATSGGLVATDLWADWGITISTADPQRPPMLFDSAAPTGGDPDLGTPNQDFGGPGVGEGGRAGGIGENRDALGVVLIISEDGDSSDPDDNANGGVLAFEFAQPMAIDSIGLLDIDDSSSSVKLFDTSGTLISQVYALDVGNNGLQRLQLDAEDVSRLEVHMTGSGAVTDLEFCADHSAPISVVTSDTIDEATQATVSLTADVAIDEWFIDWGDGNTEHVTDGSLTRSHVYDDGDETHDIYTWASTAYGVTTASNTVEVRNVDPQLDIDGVQVLNQYELFTLELSEYDPGDDTIYAWEIDWGDGSPIQWVDGNPESVNHIFAVTGEHTITAKAYDEDSPHGGHFRPDSEGQIFIEAENFHGAEDSSDATWQHITDPGQSGGAFLRSTPDNGANTGDSTSGPRRDYTVQFTEPGTYYVWTRLRGPHSGSNSVHVGIDGQPATYGKFGLSEDDGDWNWENEVHNRPGEDRVAIEVSEAGIRTISIWMREDGTEVDALLLTRDSAFIPSGTSFSENRQSTGGYHAEPHDVMVVSIPVRCLPTIDFERNSHGTRLEAGTIISDQWSDWGVTVTSSNTQQPPMLFDSAIPSGQDDDLGTPSSQFGGPGHGNGGATNSVAQGLVLIVSEDGDATDPDDAAGGGTITFSFDTPVNVETIGLLDIDDSGTFVSWFGADGSLLGSVEAADVGNNGYQDLALNAISVSRLEVLFAGSGAITSLDLCDHDHAVCEVTASDAITLGELLTVALETSETPDTVSLLWGDGSSLEQYDGNPGSYTHTYSEPGRYEVIIQAQFGGNILQHVHVVEVEAGGNATPKFFVVDHSKEEVFTYDEDINSTGRWDLTHYNSRPRGITNNLEASLLWVVDARHDVFVYDPSGAELGRWQAKGTHSSFQPQGIANHGDDLWIVDAAKDRVYYYQGGGTIRSGALSPTSWFSLDSGNRKPTGITTDGETIWISDNKGNKDKVFVYGTDGSALGSWRMAYPESGTHHPEGITIRPSGGDEIWVVDRQTDRVYYFAEGRTYREGTHLATSGSPLDSDNRNAYGITDPNQLPTAYALAFDATHSQLFDTAPGGGDLLFVGSDPDDDPLTFQVVEQPANGLVTELGDGRWTYQPNPGFVGPETFTYVANDGIGLSDPATVTINVNNDAPIGVTDSFETPDDRSPLVVDTASGVLANDYDPDNTTLVASLGTVPSFASSFSFDPDGSFTYQPNADFGQQDSFTYFVSDGFNLPVETVVTIGRDVTDPAAIFIADQSGTAFGYTENGGLASSIGLTAELRGAAGRFDQLWTID